MPVINFYQSNFSFKNRKNISTAAKMGVKAFILGFTMVFAHEEHLIFKPYGSQEAKRYETNIVLYNIINLNEIK